jgi:hypothetical protein
VKTFYKYTRCATGEMELIEEDTEKLYPNLERSALRIVGVRRNGSTTQARDHTVSPARYDMWDDSAAGAFQRALGDRAQELSRINAEMSRLHSLRDQLNAEVKLINEAHDKRAAKLTHEQRALEIDGPEA